MSDIFLRRDIFQDTLRPDPTRWSVWCEVATGAQLDDVLSAALMTSGLTGTYQAWGARGRLSLSDPLRVSFDLVLEDPQCLELAELVRIELQTFLAQGCAQVFAVQVQHPLAAPSHL